MSEGDGGHAGSEAAQSRDCFVIGPIGDRGTSIRKAADQILKYVIRPVLTDFNFKASRADELGEPGLVTRQVMRRVIDDELVIADLTGRNPNVFYELAVRHAIRKPLVQLISGDKDLPFDILDTRTIFFDIGDLDSVEQAKQELHVQVDSLLKDPKPLDNPISETVDLSRFTESGDSTESALGAVLEALADLRADVRTVERQLNSTTGIRYEPTSFNTDFSDYVIRSQPISQIKYTPTSLSQDEANELADILKRSRSTSPLEPPPNDETGPAGGD